MWTFINTHKLSSDSPLCLGSYLWELLLQTSESVISQDCFFFLSSLDLHICFNVMLIIHFEFSTVLQQPTTYNSVIMLLSEIASQK